MFANRRRPAGAAGETTESDQRERQERFRRARSTTDPSVIRHLLGLRDTAIDLILASRENIPAEALTKLGRRRNTEVVAAVVANPACSRKILRSILFVRRRVRNRPAVARALAARLDRPRLQLWRLARHKRWDVRRAVAMNEHTSPTRLRRLARDPVWSVRAAVAGNPRSPAKAFARFLTDITPVRLRMAANPHAPAAVTAACARDESAWVRAVAMGNPQVPVAFLTDAALDQPPWVLSRIANNPSCPPDRVDEILTWITLGGAGPGDPMFDPFVCNSNPIDASKSVQDFVASVRPPRNRLHSLAIIRLAEVNDAKRLDFVPLMDAARDESVLVRRRAAQFTSYPALTELMDDADPTVRQTAARLRQGVNSPPPLARWTGAVQRTLDRPGRRRLDVRRLPRLVWVVFALIGIGLAIPHSSQSPESPSLSSIEVLIGNGAIAQSSAIGSPLLKDFDHLLLVTYQRRILGNSLTLAPIGVSMTIESVSGAPGFFPMLATPTTPVEVTVTEQSQIAIVARFADGGERTYVLDT